MKEFWYESLEDYLELSDLHINPKTIKMFEVTASTESGKRVIKAVTYLRTNMIGWESTVTRNEMQEHSEVLVDHLHKQGVVLESKRYI